MSSLRLAIKKSQEEAAAASVSTTGEGDAAVAEQAASTIQSSWKRSNSQGATDEDPQASRPSHGSSSAARETERSKPVADAQGNTRTVPPPKPEIAEWVRGLDLPTAKTAMVKGLRVKVRFSTSKAVKDGQPKTKKRWFGGRVSAVSKQGGKIRIRYDDGTIEETKYPDREIIVDDTGNGEHHVKADAFVPPSLRTAAQPTQQVTPKRKRGRPPKNKTATKPEDAALSIPAVTASQETTAPKEAATASPAAAPRHSEANTAGQKRDREEAQDQPASKRLNVQVSSEEATAPSASPEAARAGQLSPKAMEQDAEAATATLTDVNDASRDAKTASVPQEDAAEGDASMLDIREQTNGTGSAEGETRAQGADVPSSPKTKPIIFDDDMFVPRSGRRAAEQAKERIASKEELVHQDQFAKKKRRRRRGAEGDDSDESDEEFQWVQCDGCGKWRVIPSRVIPTLPQQWYCANNIWDPRHASCDVPAQTELPAGKKKRRKRRRGDGDDTDAAGERTRSPVPPGDPGDSNKPRGRGRPRRNPLPRELDRAPSAASSAPEDPDNVEWVQCEKCDKWRKLPRHIAASDLPDIWYCTMNTWNTASASCDAPEDKAEGLTDLDMFGAPMKELSYRALIWGLNGKKPNRPVTERLRAAESIFKKQTDDPDAAPDFGYKDSSSFVTRAKLQAENEDPERMFLTKMIENSNVFAEMRADAAERSSARAPAAKAFPLTYESMPAIAQQNMKDIVLNALNANTLTGDDVLLRVQALEWDHVPTGWKSLREQCTLNNVVLTLCDMVKSGLVDCMHLVGPEPILQGWNPCYRRADLEASREESAPIIPQTSGSRSKFNKPWKQNPDRAASSNHEPGAHVSPPASEEEKSPTAMPPVTESLKDSDMDVDVPMNSIATCLVCPTEAVAETVSSVDARNEPPVKDTVDSLAPTGAIVSSSVNGQAHSNVNSSGNVEVSRSGEGTTDAAATPRATEKDVSTNITGAVSWKNDPVVADEDVEMIEGETAADESNDEKLSALSTDLVGADEPVETADVVMKESLEDDAEEAAGPHAVDEASPAEETAGSPVKKALLETACAPTATLAPEGGEATLEAAVGRAADAQLSEVAIGGAQASSKRVEARDMPVGLGEASPVEIRSTETKAFSLEPMDVARKPKTAVDGPLAEPSVSVAAVPTDVPPEAPYVPSSGIREQPDVATGVESKESGAIVEELPLDSAAKTSQDFGKEEPSPGFAEV